MIAFVKRRVERYNILNYTIWHFNAVNKWNRILQLNVLLPNHILAKFMEGKSGNAGNECEFSSCIKLGTEQDKLVGKMKLNAFLSPPYFILILPFCQGLFSLSVFSHVPYSCCFPLHSAASISQLKPLQRRQKAKSRRKWRKGAEKLSGWREYKWKWKWRWNGMGNWKGHNR